MPTAIEEAALTFVPGHWLPLVRLALEIPTAVSLALVALRPFLARIPPGPLRSWVDAVDQVANTIAVNTKALSGRIAAPKR